MNLFFRRCIPGVIIFLISWMSFAAENEDQLRKADSLYQAKKYTEAFQLYETLFQQSQGSPAMLAKMAFIREGLGDYANALYYLNLYYNQTSDRKALTKMRELAEKHALVGYEYSDQAFITGLVKKYRYFLLIFLFAGSLLITFYIHRKKKKHERPFTSAILQIFTIACALILVNNLFFFNYGIVSQGNSLLMKGPSAAAEPIEIIDKGHKLRLVHSDEVWSKVIWNDQEVYIRTRNLRKI